MEYVLYLNIKNENTMLLLLEHQMNNLVSLIVLCTANRVDMVLGGLSKGRDEGGNIIIDI